MKSMPTYLVGLLLVVLLPMGGLAQSNPSDYFIRRANHAVIKLIRDDYAQLDIREKNDRDDFRSLFVSEQAILMNDVLQDNRLNETISVSEMTGGEQRQKLKGQESILKILEIGPYQAEASGDGYITAIVLKEVEATTTEGHSIRDTFLLDFKCLVKTSNDAEGGNGQDPIVKIVSILPREDYGRYLIIRVVDGKSKLLSRVDLEVKGKTLGAQTMRVDSSGMFLKRIDANDVLSVTMSDPNVLFPNEIDMGKQEVSNGVETLPFQGLIASLKFRRAKFFVQLESGYCFHSLSIKPEISDEAIQNGFSFSSSLKFGSYLHHGRKGNWNLSAGVGFSRFTTQLSMSSFSYQYLARDPFDIDYLRTTQIENLQEENTISYLDIPLTLGREFYLGVKNLSLQVQGGADLKFLMDAQYQSSAQATYSGYYGPYFGITIAENGVYDFGQYSLQQSGGLNPSSLLICGHLGVYLQKQFKKRFQVYGGLNLTRNLNDMYTRTGNCLSASFEDLRSVSELNDQIKLTSFEARLGFKIKI